MSKEDKPLEYEKRIVDTKGLAQRVDLLYLSKPNRFRDFKLWLMWVVPLAAIAGAIPFVAGVGSGEKAFSNGPLSQAHAIFESNCTACHQKAFSSVSDTACRQCHDGAPHPAKAVDTARLRGEPRCAGCHVEHQDRIDLASVADGNCTGCHSDLTRRADGVKLAAVRITGFAPGRHPEFSAPRKPDERPLRLNHKVHLSKGSNTAHGRKLPMKCAGCHSTDPMSAVTFESHCRACHERELGFILPGLAADAPPAPHTKDTASIRKFILDTYEKLLDANPALLQKPLDRSFDPEPNREAWLRKAVEASEGYLFGKNCRYCHEYESTQGGLPQVKKVNTILGRYEASKPQGEPWLLRGEFSHRAHRAVRCASCHAKAATSTATVDVLIPEMKDCRSCHGKSGTTLDRCAQCHVYHDKTKERDRDRRSVEELLSQ